MRNYVIAQDGIKVRLDSPCLEGWVTPKSLDELKTYANRPLDATKFPEPKWTGAKIPADLMKQVLGTIHTFPKTETAYVLYYDPTEKKWAVKCPEQSGAGASVSFEDDGTGMPDGFMSIGSIHTHPEMGAFWSGTDMSDQQFKAGLHIVFGLHDGLVSQYKCTVFLPNGHTDQDIHDVLEDVDFDQVYEPVAEWVETIKKQSYRRPVVTRYYGHGAQVQHKQLPNTHYGSTGNAYAGYDNYVYKNPGYAYAGYSYDPDNRGQKNWWWGGWWAGWDTDGYDDVIEDRTTDISVSDTAQLQKLLNGFLASQDSAAQLIDVLLDPDLVGKLEQLTGIVITDSFDKNDVLISIEGFMTGETVLTGMTGEEARQIFEGLIDVYPELNIVDPNNALGNDVNVEALCGLITGVVDAYSESECISADIIDCLLNTLKESYTALLEAKAAHDNPQTDEVTDA